MKIGKYTFDIKCPSCGEIRAVEVVLHREHKINIYCNTCGKSSDLIAVEQNVEADNRF